MDYIDWIISSFIFLLMVSLILISISSVIPLNTQDDLYSKSIFSGVTETVPIYNFKLDSLDSEIYPYVIDVNSAAGVGQNLFLIDNNKYFSVIKNTNQFFDYNFNNPTDAMGILVLKENFNDFNYLDSFTLLPDTNINAGILELKEPTIITTNSEFYDFFGFVSTTNSIIAYVSYTDVNNNYFCRFGDSTITIGKTEDSIQTTLYSISFTKTKDWQRVFFGLDRYNNIYCKVNDTDLKYTIETTIPNTEINIQTVYNNTLIDDFYIYLNDDLSINAENINTNYFDANILETILSLNIDYFDKINHFNFIFSNTVTPPIESAPIAILKNTNEFVSAIIFPQTKEFWVSQQKGDKITTEISNINNYSVLNQKGTILYPAGELSAGNYMIPLSFKTEETIDPEKYLSFDVDFASAFQEVNAEEGDGTVKIGYYDDSQNFTNLDFNLYFDPDTNSGEIIALINSEIPANSYFNLYLFFNSINIKDVDASFSSSITLSAEQNTAQITASTVKKNTNSFYLYNYSQPDYNRTIFFNIFDKDTDLPINCDVEFLDKSLIMDNCDSDAIIKIKFRELSVQDIILENPKVATIKTKEKIITKDKFDSLSGQSYYLKLYNKILSLENATNRPTTKIYKNTTQYLTENGFLENVFVEIKPFN